MRKLVFAGAGVLLIVLVAWAGGDPWKDKPYDQWTDADIAAVLQQSPWSKIGLSPSGVGVRPSDSTAVTGGSLGVAGSGSDTSKRADGAMPDQAGGAAKSASASAGPAVYNIFWYSSRTIREALARRAVLHSGMDAAGATKFVDQPHDEYEVMIQGTNMSLFQERGEKVFEGAAYLEVKKTKQKLNPSHVEFKRGVDGATVITATFFFPKKSESGEPTISPDEKEADFYLKMGPTVLKTYFEPKRMVDAKGEDL